MAVAAATTAVLSPPTVTVAMKTLVSTAMAGALTTINNQLKAATAMVTAMVTTMAMAMATMTATAMMMETQATAAAEAQR